MKRFNLWVLFLLISYFNFGQQEEVVISSKDSIVKSSWTVGLGYNFVDDSGDVFGNLFEVKSQWNSLPYPNRLSIGRNFNSGLSIAAIGTLNTYTSGKIIDMVVIDEDRRYLAIDTRVSYDLNKIYSETSWFDPYIGIGLGYTDANNEPRGTYNAVIGFRTWLSDRVAFDLNSSGKWRMGNTGTNHIQHAAGVLYQFGIEKELSRKGKEKLALLEALKEEQERVNDSIRVVSEAREAEALAKQMAKEKEQARLAALTIEKNEMEKKRKAYIENSIFNLGHANFDLNSSYLNSKSKKVLAKLAQLLIMNSEVVIKISSHTDSRGNSDYNKWLSQKRVNRTMDYLIQLGVSANRLVTEARGEELLLNNCDDTIYCSEEEHQINRRSEFTIVKY